MLSKRDSFPIEKLLLSFVLIISVFVFVNRLLLIFSDNIDLAGIEPVFIYYIIKDFSGKSIYLDLNQIPFSNCQYVPFYFNFLAKIIDILRWSESHGIKDVYIISRSLNLLLNIFSSILVGILVTRIYNKNKYLGYIISLLSFWAFSSYFFAARPDSLKTFFLLLALFFYYKSLDASRVISLSAIAFILFASLACYTKQDVLIIITLLLLMGIFTNGFKKWLIISSGLLLSGLLILLFYYQKYGDNFISNLFLGFKFNYSFEYFTMVFGNRYIHWMIFVFLVPIFSLFIKKSDNSSKLNLLPRVLLISFPFITFVSFKWGAGVNYYLDSILLAYIILPSFLYLDFFKRRPIHFLLALIVFAFAFLSFDIHKKNISVYSTKEELKHKNISNELLEVSEKLKKFSRGSEFYLYTFEKPICNEFLESCLFPAYETSDPQFLLSTLLYYNGDTSLYLPIHPNIEIYSNSNFIQRIQIRTVFAVMPKSFGFIPYYDITKSYFEKIDSTELFYIYKSKINTSDNEM